MAGPSSDVADLSMISGMDALIFETDAKAHNLLEVVSMMHAGRLECPEDFA
jgi:hypothetical protein